ncbi:Retrovirus-related Pol polyprotein from transposon opus [Sesamum angolense]|uniref:Retrovirus-related Pol polyprotein from transposon opus n=1 Tax=Sesamum angolense TaxID=2727404 RepID=A0AAE1T683_9LAMI|nr:Retrovirus-related Pol polyprotein from transposon opus [Sesamum angolense]
MSGTSSKQFNPEIEKIARRLRKETKERRIRAKLDIDLTVGESSIFEEIEPEMATNNRRTIKELNAPNFDQQPLCITYSDTNDGFELKSGLMHLLPSFHGLAREDPHKHLKEFHVVCAGMRPHGITDEQLNMRAFPFSLKDKAKDWLYYLPSGSTETWADMKQQFLQRFFPASRATHLRKEIYGIRQLNGESLYEYWERFTELVASYLHHQFTESLLIQYFYEGLSGMDRCMVDAASGGALIDKTPDEAQHLISTMAENYRQYGYHTDKGAPKVNEDTTMGLQHLGNQISQLATFVSKLEAQASGKLPSQTETNPRENVSAITLRSGEELQPTGPTPRKAGIEKNALDDTDETHDEVDSNLIPPPLSNTCALPFPYRISKSKEEEHEKEILDTFKKVEINIPLLDAIKQIPKYAKFLKELCTNKRKLKDKERIIFGKNVSAVINRKLPEKCKDPGRPFMKTAKTKIDVDEGTLSVEFGGEIVKFNIFDAMKCPNELQALYQIDVIDSVVHDAPKLELKPLPEHLKYIYLGNEETLPAIISSKLSKEHEEKLVTLLREHRTAMGWTLADIKGISPAMCMHCIYLEDNTKPSREPQRRLNPMLKEMVMKEILKLLDAGYYQIAIAQEDQEKTTFHAHSALSHSGACLLGYVTPQVRFNDQGIVLGHVISSRAIEVDKAKVDLIVNLPYPTSVREIRSFLGHAGFYRRFIKDFAKIAQPLSRLLQKDANFVFGGDCQEAFDELK